MNQDQLADILAQHLDALLEDGTLSEEVPSELAELLAVAQNLTEVAPTPRPEFGAALKTSLLGPSPADNGPLNPTSSAGSAGSAFGSHTVLFIVVGLAGLAVILTLFISAVIFNVVSPPIFGPPSPTPRPVQTEAVPVQAEPSSPPTPAVPATSDEPDSSLSPVPTATPIIDILPAITVTVEITIQPPPLVPGPGGGSSGGGDGSSSGGDGDHDRGHGNDSDHHDEDNPGKGGDD